MNETTFWQFVLSAVLAIPGLVWETLASARGVLSVSLFALAFFPRLVPELVQKLPVRIQRRVDQLSLARWPSVALLVAVFAWTAAEAAHKNFLSLELDRNRFYERAESLHGELNETRSDLRPRLDVAVVKEEETGAYIRHRLINGRSVAEVRIALHNVGKTTAKRLVFDLPEPSLVLAEELRPGVASQENQIGDQDILPGTTSFLQLTISFGEPIEDHRVGGLDLPLVVHYGDEFDLIDDYETRIMYRVTADHVQVVRQTMK